LARHPAMRRRTHTLLLESQRAAVLAGGTPPSL
jgi:hypothetical protein